MEDIDVSPLFQSTSLSVPSPTTAHLACLSSARLQIRCLTTFEIERKISLPNCQDSRKSTIAWSPPTICSDTVETPSTSTPPRRSSHSCMPRSNRVLVSDDDTTRVYDLRDDKWSAVISNGSGGMGKNVHVEFGANEDEVLVWCDFSACLKVWCLKTGRAVEIRDPKFVGKDNKGWGYRPSSEPKGAVFALLCRSSGTDVLLLLAPHTYTVLSRTELPTTDAAGLKWSPDGRWLAIWDAASAGYRLCIYTADGNLYRTLTREVNDTASEWGVEGLGIKSVEWVPGNAWLSVGCWDRRVRILSTRTFSPVVFLDHTASIHVPNAPVYTELVDGQGTRSYGLTPQPVTPPKAPLEKNETGLMKQGISVLAFNADGSFCVTRDDATPSTVWIWDLKSLTSRMVLIQYAPIRNLLWHPSHPGRLLIQTIQDAPILYLYAIDTFSTCTTAAETTPSPPQIVELDTHITKTVGPALTKWTVAWLATPPDKKVLLALGHQQGSVLVWPDGKDQILRFEKEDEEMSDDSLYDILTGRTPVPQLRHSDDEKDDAEEAEGDGDTLDDTFRLKHTRNSTAHGTHILDDSGMDEMF